MAEPIQVRPDGDQWVVVGSDGEAGDPVDTRTEAIDQALADRTTEAVVLLRGDGSVCGELHHATPSEEERVAMTTAQAEDAVSGQVVNGGTAGEGAGS